MSKSSGQHNHDSDEELHKHRLPRRHKEAIDELLLSNNKFKPSQIVSCLEKKIKNNLINKKKVQVSGCVNRNRNKDRKQHEENTVAGVRSFTQNHPHNENVGDDGVHIAHSIVESKRFHVHSMSKNMMWQLGGRVELHLPTSHATC